ncbi:MAG: hypothetical protein M0Z47_05450 [Actinomycetota bacterium]|nr:hypothetical protein [Actinomycetota bacterium]
MVIQVVVSPEVAQSYHSASLLKLVQTPPRDGRALCIGCGANIDMMDNLTLSALGGIDRDTPLAGYIHAECGPSELLLREDWEARIKSKWTPDDSLSYSPAISMPDCSHALIFVDQPRDFTIFTLSVLSDRELWVARCQQHGFCEEPKMPRKASRKVVLSGWQFRRGQTDHQIVDAQGNVFLNKIEVDQHWPTRAAQSGILVVVGFPLIRSLLQAPAFLQQWRTGTQLSSIFVGLIDPTQDSG